MSAQSAALRVVPALPAETTAAEPDPLAVAVDVGDEGVAERLADILANVPGLKVVRPGEAADLAIVAPGRVTPRRDSMLDSDWALTPREAEVLALLAEGASNKLIARRLDISVHTAKFHVGSLLDKLDATGRTDALAHAVRLGLVHL